jgi:UDP-glucose 4-epimerase
MSSSNSQILIVGGAGFVGNALVQKIASTQPDTQIFVLDNYLSSKQHESYQRTLNDKVYKASDNLIYMYGHSSEIFDVIGNCERHLKVEINPHTVYHFGEFSRIDRSWYELDTLMKSNLYGTTRVLDFCVAKKSKLVYSASSAILTTNLNNSQEAASLTPYAWTKCKMVELIHQYRKWFNLDFLIVYFYNVYGPGQICDGPYSTVVGIFERQTLQQLPLTVVLPGTQRRCFTHINDIIDGIMLANKHFVNTEVPISSSDEVNIIELANLFIDANKQATNTELSINFLPVRKGDRTASIKNKTDVLRLQLGWNSKHSLTDYIQNIISGDVRD